MFKLGQKLKDKVSGVVGIAVARTEFINGCVRISIQPKANKDSTLPPELWFDDKQLLLVGKGIKVESKPTGGPQTPHAPK